MPRSLGPHVVEPGLERRLVCFSVNTLDEEVRALQRLIGTRRSNGRKLPDLGEPELIP